MESIKLWWVGVAANLRLVLGVIQLDSAFKISLHLPLFVPLLLVCYSCLTESL